MLFSSLQSQLRTGFSGLEVASSALGGLQVWVGRQIGTDPNGPTWQELTRIHRSSSAAPSDQDELGGSRILRPRQRVTLTTVLDLPSGEDPSLVTL